MNVKDRTILLKFDSLISSLVVRQMIAKNALLNHVVLDLLKKYGKFYSLTLSLKVMLRNKKMGVTSLKFEMLNSDFSEPVSRNNDGKYHI